MISYAGVVLDACVLYPAPLRDTLLGTASLRLFQPVWSEETMNEVTRNLIADRRMTQDGAARFEQDVNRAFPHAMTAVPDLLAEQMPTHPDDRHVAAVAVATGSPILVTFNLKHFPADGMKKLQVNVMHPDAFLCDLFEMAPFVVEEAVRRQQAKLKRPERTMGQVLVALERMVPEFVAQIRPMVMP